MPAAGIDGVDLSGARVQVALDGAHPTLLLFLGTACDGCLPFWPPAAAPGPLGLGPGGAVVVVTRDAPPEDLAELRRLCAGETARRDVSATRRDVEAPSRAAATTRRDGATGCPTVVLSGSAWTAYRVHGPPFFALVHRGRVLTEGVAWSVEQVAEDVRRARADHGLPPGPLGDGV